jgi:hypothetical protein
MALEFSRPPKDVESAIERGLRAVAPRLQPEEHAGGALAGNAYTLGVRDPHRVYYLGLDDLARGGDLSVAHFTGWRALIDNGDELLTAADMPAEGGEWPSFDRTPSEAQQLLAAFNTAEQHPFVKQHSVEPRYLAIPALYTTALWLYATDNEESLLYMLALDGKTLSEPPAWTEDRFLHELGPRARQQQALADNRAGQIDDYPEPLDTG